MDTKFSDDTERLNKNKKKQWLHLESHIQIKAVSFRWLLYDVQVYRSLSIALISFKAKAFNINPLMHGVH